MQNQDDNLELDDDLLSDDFDDDLLLDDFDEDFDDLGLDDLDEPPSAQAPAATKQTLKEKKSFSLDFNTIVIGGAVVLGLIVLSMQYLKSKNQASQGQGQGFVSSLGLEGSTESLSNQDANVNNDSEAESQGGFLNDNMSDLPEETYQVETDIDLPMPTPISEMGGERDYTQPSIMDSLEFNTSTLNNEVNMGALPEDSINISDDEFIDDEPLDQTSKMIPRAPEENIELPEGPVSNGDLNLYNDDQPISTLPDSEIQESAVTQTDGDSSALNSISQKMDVFIKRMDRLEDKIDTIDVETSQRTAMLEDTVDGLAEKIDRINVAPQVKATISKPVTRQSSVKKPSSQKNTWALKAAQPGKAWISQKGSSAIKPIKVGDQVDGIGRIESIRLINGRWLVSGSTGKINQ